MALEFTYWLPPSAVKQSGKTRIAGPILPSWTSRAARSGTLSLKLFQATCARPEPVNPTRSNSTGKRRPRPRPAASSYWGGSQSASLRTCGSPRGLSLSTLEACSIVTTVPGFQRGRFSAMLRRRGGSLYELMLHRVVHQLRIGGQTELLQDAYPIGADRAQAQHRALRELALDLAEQLQPAAARHRVIQDRHVPFELARKLHGFIAVLRLAHHQHVGLAGQHLLQAVAHHRVIVRDQDLHRETSHSISSAAEATPSPVCPCHDFH